MRNINRWMLSIFMLVVVGTFASEKTLSAKNEVVASLPMKRGFYVDTDTPCAEASNASMLLVLRKGTISGAKELCDFRRIEQVGTASYRVTQACKDLASRGRTQTVWVTIKIANDSSFMSKEVGNKRYCEQSSLPDPWRHNDIADLIK